MVLVEARVVDATHLELARPIGTRRGGKVFVSVAEAGEKDAERQEWLAASSDRLGAAYADSEPDYTPSMLRESNPDYGS
jgi:hypothetical protein